MKSNSNQHVQRHSRLVLAFVLVSLVTSQGLARSAPPPSAASPKNSSPAAAGAWTQADPSLQRARAAESIVEVQDLPRRLNAEPTTIVLDVRTPEAYAAGHLPGAIRVDYADWSKLSLSEADGLANEAAWHERIASLGITGTHRVVVYDDGRMTQAARVWFILQHFGVPHAAVVSGGFPLIQDAARAGELVLSTEPSEPTKAPSPAGTHATKSVDAGGAIGVLDRFAVREAIEAGTAQIFDARTPEEHAGTDLRKNARGGHLPGAISLPHAKLLDERNRLRPADELAKMLEEAGFKKGRPIITHCDGGGRAALAALAAARAGYGPVVNYYLSFSDWAKDATCPVVKDE
ncbi:MAG: rhodanese-like domain-containing protein [Planctomycetota bacterium]|nr:rhodanese-like domain-containing protein [Planctomycetota bacterium]